MIKEVHDNYVTPGHPTAFSAPGNLKQHYQNRFGTTPLRETLEHIDAYTYNRQYKRPRVSNPFYVFRKRQQVQFDLIDVSKLAQHNRGTTFLCCAIDVFTKHAWVRQMSSKGAATSLPTIRNILTAMGQKPEAIFFDRGK